MHLKLAFSPLLFIFLCITFIGKAVAHSTSNQFVSNEIKLPSEIVVAIDSAQNEGRAKILLPIADDIAKQLGVNVSYYSCPWARCLKAVEKGKVDLIFSVFKTKARDKFMHFLTPALATHEVSFHFLVNKDKEVTLDNYHDLQKLTIATLRGNQYFKQFDADDELDKFAAVNYQSAINMVLNNRVDAMIDLSLTPNAQLQAADPNRQLTQANYKTSEGINEYIALSKYSAWGEHSELLSKVLTSLTDAGVIERYFEQVAKLEAQH